MVPNSPPGRRKQASAENRERKLDVFRVLSARTGLKVALAAVVWMPVESTAISFASGAHSLMISANMASRDFGDSRSIGKAFERRVVRQTLEADASHNSWLLARKSTTPRYVVLRYARNTRQVINCGCVNLWGLLRWPYAARTDG